MLCALQFAVRWEQMRLTYDSIARSTDASGALVPGVKVGGLDGKTNDIKVDAFQLGATYWATKHIRVTGIWSLYHFPGDASSNEALAPGQRANAKNTDATVLHEFSARVALAL